MARHGGMGYTFIIYMLKHIRAAGAYAPAVFAGDWRRWIAKSYDFATRSGAGFIISVISTETASGRVMAKQMRE